MKLKPEHVIVQVPHAEWPSMVIGASGENCMVETDDNGARVIQMTPTDAHILIGSPMPGNLPWRAANEALLRQLGPLPKLEPGIHIASALAARYAPAPRDIADRGGITNDTLRQLGRLPQ
jgi:hypothetical protein